MVKMHVMTMCPDSSHYDPPDLSHTDWSMIYSARGEGGEGGEPESDAMERLINRYWPSVYAYVRRAGRDVHQAADLTQGFVCDVMLGRRILSEADPARGRFRSLLLQSIKHYLHERHRHDTRIRRAPDGGQPLNLRTTDLERLASPGAPTAEAAFSARWGATLIESVLKQVHEECIADCLEAHWAIFEARVVRPMLFGESPAAYPGLIERLAVESASQAANMMVTVKRRFARTMQEEVARTVREPWQVQEELNALMRDLECPG